MSVFQKRWHPLSSKKLCENNEFLLIKETVWHNITLAFRIMLVQYSCVVLIHYYPHCSNIFSLYILWLSETQSSQMCTVGRAVRAPGCQDLILERTCCLCLINELFRWSGKKGKFRKNHEGVRDLLAMGLFRKEVAKSAKKRRKKTNGKSKV